MRLTDRVTLHFNSGVSTAVVFLDTEKAIDTTWHPARYINDQNYNFRSRPV